MTTFKMPEPDFVYRHEDVCGNQAGPPTNYYTAEALRAVLEQAARISEKHFHSTTAKQIRAMKEQIK